MPASTSDGCSLPFRTCINTTPPAFLKKSNEPTTGRTGHNLSESIYAVCIYSIYHIVFVVVAALSSVFVVCIHTEMCEFVCVFVVLLGKCVGVLCLCPYFLHIDNIHLFTNIYIYMVQYITFPNMERKEQRQQRILIVFCEDGVCLQRKMCVPDKASKATHYTLIRIKYTLNFIRTRTHTQTMLINERTFWRIYIHTYGYYKHHKHTRQNTLRSLIFWLLIRFMRIVREKYVGSDDDEHPAALFVLRFLSA